MKQMNARLAALFLGGELPIGECEKLELVRVGGRRRAVLHGVRRILKYTSCEMRFALKEGSVTVVGSELTCTVYTDRTVEIEGKMQALAFSEEGK